MPSCESEEETFEHTPPPVITAIMKGFQDWLNPVSIRSRAPTYGSVYGPDIFLTSAYYEQFHTLTWYQLCLGRISLNWSRAVSSYHASLIPNFDGPRWASAFISILWNFTRQLWHHRNQIVHGLTVDEIVNPNAAPP
jgi:hypothetical protein